MDIDVDRLALLVGRLVLQAEANWQKAEKLQKELAEAKDKKDGD